jgi:hypothetical protein
MHKTNEIEKGVLHNIIHKITTNVFEVYELYRTNEMQISESHSYQILLKETVKQHMGYMEKLIYGLT